MLSGNGENDGGGDGGNDREIGEQDGRNGGQATGRHLPERFERMGKRPPHPGPLPQGEREEDEEKGVF